MLVLSYFCRESYLHWSLPVLEQTGMSARNIKMFLDDTIFDCNGRIAWLVVSPLGRNVCINSVGEECISSFNVVLYVEKGTFYGGAFDQHCIQTYFFSKNPLQFPFKTGVGYRKKAFAHLKSVGSHGHELMNLNIKGKKEQTEETLRRLK